MDNDGSARRPMGPMGPMPEANGASTSNGADTTAAHRHRLSTATILKECVLAAREVRELILAANEGPLSTAQFPTCLNSIAGVLEREAPKYGLAPQPGATSSDTSASTSTSRSTSTSTNASTSASTSTNGNGYNGSGSSGSSGSGFKLPYTTTDPFGQLLEKHIGDCSRPTSDDLLADLRDMLCALLEALAGLPCDTENIRYFVAACVELICREIKHRRDLRLNGHNIRTMSNRLNCIVCELKNRYFFKQPGHDFH